MFNEKPQIMCQWMPTCISYKCNITLMICHTIVKNIKRIPNINQASTKLKRKTYSQTLTKHLLMINPKIKLTKHLYKLGQAKQTVYMSWVASL